MKFSRGRWRSGRIVGALVGLFACDVYEVWWRWGYNNRSRSWMRDESAVGSTQAHRTYWWQCFYREGLPRLANKGPFIAADKPVQVTHIQTATL